MAEPAPSAAEEVPPGRRQLGVLLRKTRGDRSLSKVAAELGVASTGTITRWETTGCAIQKRFRSQVAQFLRIDVSEVEAMLGLAPTAAKVHPIRPDLPEAPEDRPSGPALDEGPHRARFTELLFKGLESGDAAHAPWVVTARALAIQLGEPWPHEASGVDPD